MPRMIRALAACALISALAACVAPRPPRKPHAPPPPPPSQSQPRPAPASTPAPPPRDIGLDRLDQVDSRIDILHRRIDARVDKGFYPQPQGDSLHHRLDVIREEAHDMAAQHGGGVSADEQRVLNQELDGASRIIGE